MADISFNIACKELRIAQTAQHNRVFQLLHLVHIYGHGFFEWSRIKEEEGKQWRQERFTYSLKYSKLPHIAACDFEFQAAQVLIHRLSEESAWKGS